MNYIFYAKPSKYAKKYMVFNIPRKEVKKIISDLGMKAQGYEFMIEIYDPDDGLVSRFMSKIAFYGGVFPIVSKARIHVPLKIAKLLSLDQTYKIIIHG